MHPSARAREAAAPESSLEARANRRRDPSSGCCWLRANGVNTNGVTAQILVVDGFEQVLNMHFGGMTQICNSYYNS